MNALIYLFLILCFILIFIMIRNAFENHVIHTTLEFECYPKTIKSLTIFFISDIHRRNISIEVLKEVKEKVDYVIIGGDLTEKGVPMERVNANLKKLRDLAPAIFVWGNNDYEVNQSILMDTLELNDIRPLKNDVIYGGDQEIAFIGVDDATQEMPPLEETLAKANKCAFQIFISHQPKIVDVLPENHNISLSLSGHTHGGQIRILGIGPYQKGQMTQSNGLTKLVSNGYGTTLLPMRLGAKAETHLITIRGKSNVT